MGIYVNPGNENLKMALNSQIFVDKSLFIGKISEFLNTQQKFVCVSRPRRFGKSMIGDLGESARRFVDFLAESQVAVRHILPLTPTGGDGCPHQMTHGSKTAIIPICYSGDRDRKLSNHDYLLIYVKRAPILGRIAMNLTTIDVTDIPDVKAEDEVVLIGEQGDQIIRAEQLAGLAGTINYEVVARLSSRIPKVVVD